MDERKEAMLNGDENVKWLCYSCVGDEFLSSEVRKTGKTRTCSYCGKKKKTQTIEYIARRVETALNEHFRETLDHPDDWQYTLLSDKEFNYSWDRDGDPLINVIAMHGGVESEIAGDIQGELSNAYFDLAANDGETGDSYYKKFEPSSEQLENEWHSLKKSLKYESRFFNRKSKDFFNRCFFGIDKIDGKKFVVDAGPNTEIQSLVRARVFQKETELIEALKRPDLHLSAPPSDCASKGRMNAHGISVFYGSDKPEVALSEVRPPAGSRVLLSAFKICRPIRLLNLQNTESGGVKGSVFDPAYAPLLARIKFLGILAEEIARPILPDNAEYEYLPTQAIADFLANENEPLLDGVIFPSSQFPDGRNFVLFNKASLVEEIDIPDGLKIDARLGSFEEDGFVTDYEVVEIIPRVLNANKPDTAITINNPFMGSRIEKRIVTLQIDLNSVKVFKIQSVKIESTKYKVSRNRVME